MAKFTKKEVTSLINDLFVDLTPDAMVVTTTEGKGKNKKEVVDAEASFQNISQNLLYYRGLLDGADIFEPVHPDGTSEILDNRKNEFDTLYAYAEENFAEEMEAFVEAMGIESFGTYDGEDTDDEEEENDDILSNLELSDLKAVAKALGEKVTKKDTEESLIEKIEEYEEDDINSVLEELGFFESEEETADEDDEEEETEDEADYSEMSLSELRAECKERGIKYTPKMKAEEIIELLVADDEENADEEDEEEETEESLLDGLSLDDLKAVAKALGEKVTKKDTEESLIEKIEEYEESDIEDVLSELGLIDEDEEEADEEDDEEEEGSEYENMSLSELRKECKAREIKYTPKLKEADLIALLEESDASDDEEEDEEDGDDDETVDESELDEILDEEFEDEVLEKEEEEEKKTSKKVGKLPPKKRK